MEGKAIISRERESVALVVDEYCTLP